MDHEAEAYTRFRLPSKGVLLLAGFLFAAWLGLFIVRMTGPIDIMDRDQERPAAYVLDCIDNGHWASQRDVFGFVMSKPPFYTWLAAVPTYLMGRVSRLSLALPSGLAVFGIALILFRAGERYLGRRAGFWAGLMFLLTTGTYKQLGLIRTDPVLGFTVILGVWVAFEAWRGRRTWVWFWLIAAASMLTKGPVGPAFMLGALAAVVWERLRPVPAEPTADDAPALRPSIARWSQLAGIALFLGITGGWFALAYVEDGQDFIAKVIGRELVHHAVGEQGEPYALRFLSPLGYLLTRYLPWTLLSVWGVWRSLARPAPDPDARRFERFLLCHLAVGLVLLAMATHKRDDLVFPLAPAVMLFAGRELARLVPGRRWKPALAAAVCLTVLAWVGHAAYEHKVRAAKPQNAKSRALQQLAQQVKLEVPEKFPFMHFASPYGFQFFMDTIWRYTPPELAGELLRGDRPAFVVVAHPELFEKHTGLALDELHELWRCELDGQPYVLILSNYPELELTERLATCINGLRIELDHFHLIDATETYLHIELIELEGAGALQNTSDEVREITLRASGGVTDVVQEVRLEPGERKEFGLRRKVVPLVEQEEDETGNSREVEP